MLKHYLNILKNESVIKILRFFCTEQGSCSGREVARRLSLNLVSTQKNLDYLVSANVLTKKIHGRSYLFELNSAEFVQEQFVKLFVREKMSYKRALDLILESTIDFSSEIIMFGSYARGDFGVGSDLDIMFLSTQKEKLNEAIEALSGELEDQFGVGLSAKLFSYDEIDRIQTDIMAQIEDDGVWLFGEKKWQAKIK